jgi:hypothetical protein
VERAGISIPLAWARRNRRRGRALVGTSARHPCLRRVLRLGGRRRRHRPIATRLRLRAGPCTPHRGVRLEPLERERRAACRRACGPRRSLAALSLEGNRYFSGERPEQTAAAQAAIARYRRAVELRFGALQPFETLTTIPADLEPEFRAWVTSVQARAAERDRAEHQAATARKRQASRDKASSYAQRSAATSPPNPLPPKDGSRYNGTCSACGASTILRLTTYEEFTFGLCIPCYFSKAW